jgi:alpha-glucosidase
LHKEGSTIPIIRSIKINLIGLPFKVKMIEIDNVEVSFDINTLEMSGYLIVDKEFTALHISENNK